MNSKTTLPLLDAAAHDEVVDVLRRLAVAYPDYTPNEVACSVARCAFEHAGVKAEALSPPPRECPASMSEFGQTRRGSTFATIAAHRAAPWPYEVL